ncbi:MAG: hydantoinase B/oxoprolinase family protein [Proteobacteria bacterium]|jgi:N-methylhydantoinase B|nr:hydantoinase B/oxoprolinase family protein [Pseudomonadota bacterium]
MNSMHTEWLQEFIGDWLDFGDSAALLGPGHQTLGLRYETLADIGTLGVAAQTVVKYFSLEEGDVVLLNDPYSGGSTLSMMTFVVGLAGGFSWVIRTGFRPKLVMSKKLEEEGLRIPPTPLVQKFEMNSLIADAIYSHPQCPPTMKRRMTSLIPEILHKVRTWALLHNSRSPLLKTSNLNDYLQASRSHLEALLSEVAQGDARVETKLETGELIKLKLSLKNQQLFLDFSGTGPSQRICMTDAATIGACFGAFKAFLNTEIPVNSTTLEFLEVTTPLGSLLNSKYPSPTFRGMTEGCALVASTVIQGLSEVMPQRKINLGASSPLMISLDFSDQRSFFDVLPSGVSASSLGDGSDALHFWTRNRLQNSVEEIERYFPLRIHHVGIRGKSGGQGKFRGGNGVIKEYEVLEAAQLNWVLPSNKIADKAGLSGQSAEIILIEDNKTRIHLDQIEGHRKILKGSRLIVSSSGGHGF